MTDTKTDNTALTDLIQLPDGNWIDPARVTGLKYAPPTAGSFGKNYGDRVIVEFGDRAEIIYFSDAIAAVTFRDDLACKANAAKAKARRVLGVETADDLARDMAKLSAIVGGMR